MLHDVGWYISVYKLVVFLYREISRLCKIHFRDLNGNSEDCNFMGFTRHQKLGTFYKPVCPIKWKTNTYPNKQGRERHLAGAHWVRVGKWLHVSCRGGKVVGFSCWWLFVACCGCCPSCIFLWLLLCFLLLLLFSFFCSPVRLLFYFGVAGQEMPEGTGTHPKQYCQK